MRTRNSLHIRLGVSYSAVSEVASEWTPAQLFAASEQGAWYDPSDSSTVFQDAACTTPAGVGDVVGCIQDKSGNGNHATQSTTAAKPILRQSGDLYYLELDGTDDFLTSSSIDFSGSSNASLYTAARTSTPISNNSPVVMFGGDTIAGSCWIASGDGSQASWRPYLRGDAGTSISERYLDPAPVTRVLGGLYDISQSSGNEITFRVDGSDVTGVASGDAGGGSFGNNTIKIGKNTRNFVVFYGFIYGSFLIDRTLSTEEIQLLETYLAAKSGVSL